jgi:hypothetical protein
MENLTESTTMDKLNKIEISDLYANKVLSILLITINTLLCYNFIPNDFTETLGGKIISTTPIFTLLFTGYAIVYKIKSNIAKIIYGILIIVSVVFLCFYYWVSNFMRGN